MRNGFTILMDHSKGQYFGIWLCDLKRSFQGQRSSPQNCLFEPLILLYKWYTHSLLSLHFQFTFWPWKVMFKVKGQLKVKISELCKTHAGSNRIRSNGPLDFEQILTSVEWITVSIQCVFTCIKVVSEVEPVRSTLTCFRLEARAYCAS